MPVLHASTIVRSVLLLPTVRPVILDIIILLLILVWLVLVNILVALNALLELAWPVIKLDILLVLLHVQSAIPVWQAANSVPQVLTVLSVQLAITKQEHHVLFAQLIAKFVPLMLSANLVWLDTGYQELLVLLALLLVFLAVHLQLHVFHVLLDITLMPSPALPVLA